jgi:DNA polymerase III alpha subunit
MSKLSALSASLRWRSKRENSAALLNTTKKKSSSSTQSTAVCQNPKGSGQLEMSTRHPDVSRSDADLIQELVIQLTEMLMEDTPRRDLLLSALTTLVGVAQVTRILEVRPWQEDG